MQPVDWAEALRGDFLAAYSAFLEKLEDAMNGCIPKRVNTKERKNIYLTPDAMRKKDLKNRLWRRYKHTKSHYDRTRYVRTKNSLRSLTRNLRRTFESKLAKDLKTSPKKFWSYVKSRTKSRIKIPSLRRADGSVASTSSEKAEALNNFFSSVFTKENLSTIPRTEQEFLGNRLNAFVITPEAVLKKLQDLNPGKTPGPDGWHPVLLKSIADLIAQPLSILFQKSLDEGVLPMDWLKACVTSIHKKGAKNLPDNYRPVSITSVICKLMESIVRDQIVAHMVENNLFSKKQHGFVPWRDCMTNLTMCMELWTQMLEAGDAVDVLYTDFSKAFDSVPHQRLLKKMSGIGITGSTLNWVESFLSNRQQRVRVEDKYSEWKQVISGIPQGSVLGPTLFVIFINDMPDVVECMIQLFADDAKNFTNVNIRDDGGNNKLQSDINNLSEWSTKWQLPFNTRKCKVLHLGNSNPCHRYKMNGQKLEQVNEEKDLGVIIDKELRFHKQAAAAVKKANSRLGLIKKSFAVLDETTLPLLYNSLVRPHLEYGNLIWGPFLREQVIAVEKVQRRATKTVRAIKDLSYEDRLKKLSLPSLQHRRRRGDMIFAYKIFTEKLNLDKNDFFTSSTSLTRGHQHAVIKRKATKLCRSNTFSNRIIDDWNSLPSEVVSATTTNSFKNKLDEYWADDIYETPF